MPGAFPVAHIDFTWSDNEYRMLAHMKRQIQELIELAQGRVPCGPQKFSGTPWLSGILNQVEKGL